VIAVDSALKTSLCRRRQMNLEPVRVEELLA